MCLSVHVTVNMYNRGIRVFPKNFREYPYSLNQLVNTRIPQLEITGKASLYFYKKT